mmetsp:Transcript_11633/g.27868  ORF Transcript_11633/g.27868 Transcript_11633/m.27868 type:complete len:337 (+) Transcript_11633:232-1242(+)
MDKENSGINTSSAQEEEEGTNVDPELVKQFFVAAKSSLLHNFDRIVKPVPDDDYSDYVDQYHFVLDNKWSFEDEMEGENDSDRNGKEHADGADVEEEEPEIDEEELIDASAWMDARELRSRVRAKAARVQQLRERVLNGTTNRVTKICLQPHVTDVKPEIIMGEEESPIATTTTKNVNESLKALSLLLEDPKWQQFPERIQSLQDTIEVMQKDSAPNRLLSQTELAITGGRRNIAVAGNNNVVDGIPEDATAEGQEVDVNQYKDPMEDILAQKVLLMQVQDNGSNNDDDRFGLESHQGDENDVGDDMHMDVDDKEDSTAQPMDAIDRLALFGHMFS